MIKKKKTKQEDIGMDTCKICKRLYSITHLYKRIDKKLPVIHETNICFHCFSKKSKIKTYSELVDFYIFGSYYYLVEILGKTFFSEKEHNQIIKDLKNSPSVEVDAKEIYDVIRKKDPNRRRSPKLIKRIRKIYKDECPYCHRKLYFHKFVLIGFYCKCGKYIERFVHPFGV